jgi:hypothetical protein
MEAKAIIQADRTDQLRGQLHAMWGSWQAGGASMPIGSTTAGPP